MESPDSRPEIITGKYSHEHASVNEIAAVVSRSLAEKRAFDGVVGAAPMTERTVPCHPAMNIAITKSRPRAPGGFVRLFCRPLTARITPDMRGQRRDLPE